MSGRMNARRTHLMLAAMSLRMAKAPGVRTKCPECKTDDSMSGPASVRFDDGHKVTALVCERCGLARVGTVAHPAARI